MTDAIAHGLLLGLCWTSGICTAVGLVFLFVSITQKDDQCD